MDTPFRDGNSTFVTKMRLQVNCVFCAAECICVCASRMSFGVPPLSHEPDVDVAFCWEEWGNTMKMAWSSNNWVLRYFAQVFVSFTGLYVL